MKSTSTASTLGTLKAERDRQRNLESVNNLLELARAEIRRRFAVARECSETPKLGNLSKIVRKLKHAKEKLEAKA